MFFKFVEFGYKSRFLSCLRMHSEDVIFLYARDKHLTGYALITSIARARALGWFFSLLKGWVVFERQPASSAANGGSDAMKKEASKVRRRVLELCCNGFFARVARSHKQAYEEKMIRELEAPPGAFGLLLLQLQQLPLFLGACFLGLLPE